MKRNVDGETNGCKRFRKDVLDRIKAEGCDVLQLSKKLSNEEGRWRAGLKAMGVSEEEEVEIDDYNKFYVQKMLGCKEIGKKAGRIFSIKNMIKDWREEGWMHWKAMFSPGFIKSFLIREVNELMEGAKTHEVGIRSEKKMTFNIMDLSRVNSQFTKKPIHQFVFSQLLEEIAGRETTVREIILQYEGKQKENLEYGEYETVLPENKMKELAQGREDENNKPLALFVPLTSKIIMKTQQQYKQRLGRPRKAKCHCIDIGDVFLVNWRQVHKMEPCKEVKARQHILVLALAKCEDFLMY